MNDKCNCVSAHSLHICVCYLRKYGVGALCKRDSRTIRVVKHLYRDGTRVSGLPADLLTQITLYSLTRIARHFIHERNADGSLKFTPVTRVVFGAGNHTGTIIVRYDDKTVFFINEYKYTFQSAIGVGGFRINTWIREVHILHRDGSTTTTSNGKGSDLSVVNIPDTLATAVPCLHTDLIEKYGQLYLNERKRFDADKSAC